MNASLNALLRQTSRSFYLTLRALPAAVRPQIGLAYLLARTTDTIADTELIPPAQRLAALQALRGRILGTSAAPLDFGALARSQAAPAERALLENVEAALTELQKLFPADLQLTRAVLDTITSGQELDLKRFQSERMSTPALTPALSPEERGNAANALANPTLPDSSQRGSGKLPLLGERVGVRAVEKTNIIALRTDAELDDYTYRVAGCVGEFWTKICRAHIFPNANLDDAKLLADGIRFGKGLQLVNILRDLPADLQKGRCYLPADGLAKLGLSPTDLLNPATEPNFRPLYNEWLDRAEAHLVAGWAYTNSLPWGCIRVRLACAWPILIGLETLARLRQASVLDASQRVKISRAEVRRLMWRSVLFYPLPAPWRGIARLPRSL